MLPKAVKLTLLKRSKTQMKSFLNFFCVLFNAIVEARTQRVDYLIKTGKMY
jgi:hypothetical protein